MQKILILEDDLQLMSLLSKLLLEEKYELVKSSSISRAEELLEKNDFDLLIMDRILPDGDSLDFLEKIRKKDQYLRVLIFSRKRFLEDRIKALRLADDFLAKPFTSQEFLLKIKNILKRAKKINKNVLYLSDSTYLSDGVIFYDEKETKKYQLLRKKEMLILECLLKHQNSLVSYQSLISYVWGYKENRPGRKTINVYIRRIRMKLGAMSQNLETIRGRGYRYSIKRF